MASSSHLEELTRPETVVLRLRAQLGNHALWDAILILLPPVLASLWATYFLVQGAWVSPLVGTAIAILANGFGALAVTLRYRKRIPKLPQAAQLVDKRAGAKDHFLTLATIDPANCPEPLLSRLRQDAEELVGRVELTRDFPYKVKTPMYWSAGSSLIALLLLYFLLPVAGAMIHPVSTSQRLRQLAEKMAQAPQLKELAEPLKTLAAKLEDTKIQPEEKQAAVKELEQKIAERRKQEDEKKNRDLLSQAADELKGVEQQQSAGGQEQQKNQSQGGGNLQSNLPKEGQGEGKQSQGGGGADGEGQMSAQSSKEMEQGKSAQGNPKEPGQDKNQQHQGDANGNQPDPNQPGKELNKDRADKGQGGSKEGSGKNQSSEEPPQSAPPAERFYQAGEGKDGLKGARYVTVQLPEEVAADGKGESKATKEGTGKQRRSQVPVSNVPLPAHVPNAPAEKQQMPIEYRGIIR